MWVLWFACKDKCKWCIHPRIFILCDGMTKFKQLRKFWTVNSRSIWYFLGLSLWILAFETLFKYIFYCNTFHYIRRCFTSVGTHTQTLTHRNVHMHIHLIHAWSKLDVWTGVLIMCTPIPCLILTSSGGSAFGLISWWSRVSNFLCLCLRLPPNSHFSLLCFQVVLGSKNSEIKISVVV